MVLNIMAILGFLSAFFLGFIPLVCLIVISIRNRKEDPSGFKWALFFATLMIIAILDGVFFN